MPRFISQVNKFGKSFCWKIKTEVYFSLSNLSETIEEIYLPNAIFETLRKKMITSKIKLCSGYHSTYIIIN